MSAPDSFQTDIFIQRRDDSLAHLDKISRAFSRKSSLPLQLSTLVGEYQAMPSDAQQYLGFAHDDNPEVAAATILNLLAFPGQERKNHRSYASHSLQMVRTLS